jgi:hypothetical protein
MPKFEPISLDRDNSANVAYPEPYPSEGLSLYINHPCVVDLPEEGTITFRFKRGPVTLTQATKSSPSRATTDLCLCEIVDCTEEKSESESEATREANAIDRIFEQVRKEEKE